MTRVAGPALLLAPARSYAEHQTIWGALPRLGPRQLVDLVGAAGLTGRGGAAFPTARKLAAVAAGSNAVVVANGAEGEPASRKDRTLLHTAPHLVLDGLQLAARATGATSAYVYAPEDTMRAVVAAAIAERRDAVPVAIVFAPDTFLAGEESAVVSAIERRPALPRTTPPRVFEKGVQGRPTLVQNVESLAQIALIAYRGPEEFRRGGTDAEPGPRLVTITGAVAAPGVYEVPGGSSLGDLLYRAGGLSEPIQALLVGGFHGGWVPLDKHAARLTLSRTDLAPYDAAPGAGVIVAQPARTCGLVTSAQIVSYLAGQGARQCGPCRNGLPTLASTMGALAAATPSRGLDVEVQRVAALVERRGACHHPAGTVRLIRSTLRTFTAEVGRHLTGYCSVRPELRRAS